MEVEVEVEAEVEAEVAEELEEAVLEEVVAEEEPHEAEAAEEAVSEEEGEGNRTYVFVSKTELIRANLKEWTNKTTTILSLYNMVAFTR